MGTEPTTSITANKVNVTVSNSSSGVCIIACFKCNGRYTTGANVFIANEIGRLIQKITPGFALSYMSYKALSLE
jgi:hypothetical protein